MKSPNVKSTSVDEASRSDARLARLLRIAIAAICLAPAIFASCKSTQSDMAPSRPSNNPYAKYDPKTPEEEAYYRDVYSGDWGEGNFGGAMSIGKSGVHTTLPEHWKTTPSGAKTLEQIRYEASQRNMSRALANERPYRAPVAAPVAPQYSQPYGERNLQTAPPAPPIQSAPANDIYSKNALPTPAAQPTAQNAYAQVYQPQPQSQPVATQAQVQPQKTAVQQNPQYVAQVQNNAVVGAQPFAPGSVQQQPTQVVQPQTQPVTTQPQTVQPQSVQPQPQPVQPQPRAAISASIDWSANSELIVRGQEPEEDDDIFGSDDEDAGLFGDDEDADVEEETTTDAADEQESTDAAKETTDATQPESTVQITRENVTVKSVAPEAAAGRASAATIESNAAPNEVVAVTKPADSNKLPITIDPSIADRYAGVKRVEENPPASSTEEAARRTKMDEYVISGGDSKGSFFSRKDWSYENLDPEDTAAHFDTVDGRILSEPSNRVFIYAPRFGAVRQILGALEGDHMTAVEVANVADEATVGVNVEGVDVREQETKALGANGTQAAEGTQASDGITLWTGNEGVMEAGAQLRLGAMITALSIDDLSGADATLMFDGALAAQGWSGEQGVAVAADLVNAFSNAYVDGPATIYHIQDGTKTSKLRVVKIANKEAAKPGEFVEFALRFENIGDEPIGNVTILDNLSARLRYVEGTAQSSTPADFLADLSETGSLILRWEIQNPLQPKEFGVVRYICKVQ